MGALDGVRFSNSFLFHKRFNWKGLLVELSPTNFEKLVQNRPNELANVNAGVCGRRQTLHFVEGGRNGIRVAVGGIWEHSPESFRERWWRGVDLNQTQTIECTPLVDIIQEHTPEVNYFDFLSLDVEGGEFDVIQAIDFNQVGFGILIVEADYHNHDRNVLLRNLLENRGYVFLGHNSPNNWFVNKKFSQIYRGLLNNAELNNATL
jgi:FkbM family methyltransferase